MTKLFRTVAVAGLLLGLSACETTQYTIRSTDPYLKVFHACVDTMGDLSYSVTSADATSGMIVADKQVVMSHGASSRLNVFVTDESTGTKVVVKYIPPPGPISDKTAQFYIDALKTKVSGVQIVTGQ